MVRLGRGLKPQHGTGSELHLLLHYTRWGTGSDTTITNAIVVLYWKEACTWYTILGMINGMEVISVTSAPT